ncbi:MAG: PAS domain S-box protein [Bacteriovoracaceae bacterium]
MKKAPIPVNEVQRIKDLKNYRILDTFPDPAFDEITRLAANICGTKIALVSLIDEDRQWFKSRFGLEAKETPRDISYCGHAIMGDDIFIVEDSEVDSRFCDNPLFLGEPHVRFYAGVPLKTPSGNRIGTLCVIDSTTKKLDQTKIEILKSLAKHVVDILELKSHTEDLLAVNSQYKAVQAIALTGGWELDIKTGYIKWSDIIFDIFSMPKVDTPFSRQECINIFKKEDHAKANEILDRLLHFNIGFEQEFQIIDKNNIEKWIKVVGRPATENQENKIFGTVQDITEQKKTKLQIVKNSLEMEAYLKGLNKYAKVLKTDAHGRITFVNDNFCKISGYSREELIGKNPRILNSGYHPRSFFENLWRTISSGQVWRGEIKNRRKNGEEYWIDTTIVPQISLEGEIEGYLAFRYDITERKLTEEKLKLSELKYRQNFSQSADSIMTLAPPFWKFTSANPATLYLFEVESESEFCTLGPWNISPAFQPDGEFSADKAKRMIQIAIEKGSHLFEWTHSTINGKLMNCVVLLSRINQDESMYLQATVRDITLQKKLEQQLIEAQAISKIGSWHMDLITKEQTWSLEHYKIFEIEYPQSQETLFQMYRERIHPDDRSTLDRVVAKALEGEDFVFNHRVYLDGGKRIKYVQGIGKVHKDKDGRPIAISGTCRDRTKEVEMEMVLESERSKALHNAKLASIGQLAAGVGHEINNPLAIISGQVSVISELISSSNFSADKVNERLKKIENSVTRISNIVKGLRTFTRSDQDQISNFNISKLLNESIDLLKEIYAKEEVLLTYETQCPDSNIVGNQGRIQQLFVNLISNAKDATIGKKKREISIKLETKDGHVVINVCDNGHGIGQEIKDRIFDPFFTTKEVNKGTGLGLSIVNTIVKEHNGRIELETELNVGTKFIVYLPLAHFLNTQSDQDIKKESSLSKRFDRNILVVEDEEAIRDIIVNSLEENFANVFSASNGLDGLKILKSQKIHLVISDIKMPLMDGFSFLKEIRNNKSLI